MRLVGLGPGRDGGSGRQEGQEGASEQHGGDGVSVEGARPSALDPRGGGRARLSKSRGRGHSPSLPSVDRRGTPKSAREPRSAQTQPIFPQRRSKGPADDLPSDDVPPTASTGVPTLSPGCRLIARRGQSSGSRRPRRAADARRPATLIVGALVARWSCRQLPPPPPRRSKQATPFLQQPSPLSRTTMDEQHDYDKKDDWAVKTEPLGEPSGRADKALELLQQGAASYQADPIVLKKLVRKIDWMLMPIMITASFLQCASGLLVSPARALLSSRADRLRLNRLASCLACPPAPPPCLPLPPPPSIDQSLTRRRSATPTSCVLPHFGSAWELDLTLALPRLRCRTQFGIQADTGMKGNEFAWLGSAFYVRPSCSLTCSQPLLMPPSLPVDRLPRLAARSGVPPPAHPDQDPPDDDGRPLGRASSLCSRPSLTCVIH